MPSGFLIRQMYDFIKFRSGYANIKRNTMRAQFSFNFSRVSFHQWRRDSIRHGRGFIESNAHLCKGTQWEAILILNRDSRGEEAHPCFFWDSKYSETVRKLGALITPNEQPALFQVHFNVSYSFTFYCLHCTGRTEKYNSSSPVRQHTVLMKKDFI